MKQSKIGRPLASLPLFMGMFSKPFSGIPPEGFSFGRARVLPNAHQRAAPFLAGLPAYSKRKGGKRKGGKRNSRLRGGITNLFLGRLAQKLGNYFPPVHQLFIGDNKKYAFFFPAFGL